MFFVAAIFIGAVRVSKENLGSIQGIPRWNSNRFVETRRIQIQNAWVEHSNASKLLSTSTTVRQTVLKPFTFSQGNLTNWKIDILASERSLYMYETDWSAVSDWKYCSSDRTTKYSWSLWLGTDSSLSNSAISSRGNLNSDLLCAVSGPWR